jgi:hypothetical protein
MAAQHMTNRADSVASPAGTAQEIAVRLVGALLALAVSAVHVADQGGVTAFTSPDWMGWGYRLIEAGGVLTAAVLLLAPLAPRPSRSARPAWSALARCLGWAAGVLLGTGPFVAYLASRTVGMPGDPGDVGNWGQWVGTVSLLVEAALVVLSVTMLLALRHSGRKRAARSGRVEFREYPRLSDSGRYASTTASRPVRCAVATQPSSVPSCPRTRATQSVARRHDETADAARQRGLL